MANVKRRLNAPKSALRNVCKRKQTNGCKKKELRSLKSVIDTVLSDSNENGESEPGVTKKRKTAANDNVKTLASPYEKCNLQNKLKPKLKSARNTRQSKHYAMDVPTPELPGLMKTKTSHLRSSKYLKIMDNVILSEFGLPSKLKKCLITQNKGVTNNNKKEIINQNSKIIHSSQLSNKDNQTPSQAMKFAAVNSADVLGAPAGTVPAIAKPACHKQKTVLVTFTDKLKPQPPPLRKKGRPKKNPDIPKSPPNSPPKKKRVSVDSGIVFKLPVFECDYCGKVFNRKHSLVRHVYLHLGQKPHTCPVCPKKFRIRKNMKNHVAKDHCVPKVDDNTQSFCCEICDKPFLSEESLKLHITSHAKGENSFKCIYCDKKFAYQLLLIQHEKKHLVTGKYLCTLCDTKFKSRDKLYVHVKSHLKLIDYICQYCGREFLRANSMKRHIQTMHAGRTIQCPICNKSLKGHLSEHLRTHDKNRPHECPECGKLFTQSTQLRVHRRGHTGSRPYSCRICDRSFSHSNALMLHHRCHTGEKPFPCAECPLGFSQLPHMKAHMLKIHGKTNPYKCLKCCDYFKLKKDLLVHKKSCNGTGIDTDLYGDEKLHGDSLEGMDSDVIQVASTMTLSRMRFLLALLLTMIGTKEKLKYLGFNKRLVDDLLVESLEAMGQIPCRDDTMTPLVRLRTNIEKLLKGTVPTEQMAQFKKENKSMEELLELLTSEKDK